MLTDESIQIIPIKIKYAHHHMVLRSNFWLSDCDISFPGNKLVSGHHCTVEKDEGQVWLRDSRWVKVKSFKIIYNSVYHWGIDSTWKSNSV